MNEMEKAIETLKLIKKHYNRYEITHSIDLAIKAFEFIEENFPNSFIDYLNGVQI